MKRIVLRKNEEKRLQGGHLWAFSNEIQEIQGAPEAGEVVALADAGGKFLGQGFFNPRSLIAFRLLTVTDEPVDRAFWRARIGKALEYRRSVLPEARSFRAVFGESDLLPGLIVDKYEDVLAVQFLSAGLETHRDDVLGALDDVFAPRGIIARNDSALRRLEGLEEKVEVLAGEVPDAVVIEENGIRFTADLHGGQKTGFFFDQRENRAAFGALCAGKRVMDVFCHTGGFGIYALKGGAKAAVFVDASRHALELAEANAALNGFRERFDGLVADALEYLPSVLHDAEKFDIINVDPPALIKSRKHFHAGYKAYRKINALALAALGPGGILATSSCSHNLSPVDFRTMLTEAAARAGKQVRILEFRSQAKDHPVLLSMPETEYLKFAVLQVI